MIYEQSTYCTVKFSDNQSSKSSVNWSPGNHKNRKKLTQDGNPYSLRGRDVLGVFRPIGLNDVLVYFCNRLVCEKFTVFPYGQYIFGNVFFIGFSDM